MNKNIEIKARATDFHKQKKFAQKISDSPLVVLNQEDTFFVVNSGRLKLREFDDNHAELIFYKRSDTFEAKQSNYKIYPAENPEILKKTLTMSLGIIGIVKKTRLLYRFGQTRIHLDEVNNLGHFIEFEYVLKPNENIKNGQKVIDNLMKKVNIKPQDLISNAYIDLLLSD